MERCAVVPYEGNQDYIFVSYCHRDMLLAAPIMERLAAEGYRLWYDEGIDPGSEWPETIAQHLSNAAACIGLISPNYLQSDNCRREMNFALKKRIPFLSVVIEETELSSGVEMQLSVIQAIFKYKLPSEDVFYQKINGTGILRSSREVPFTKEPEPIIPIQQAAPIPESKPIVPARQKTQLPKTKPVVPARQKAPALKPKTASDPRSNKKKAILIAVAAVLALCVIGGITAGILLSGKNRLPASADVPAATDAPVSSQPAANEPDPNVTVAPVQQAEVPSDTAATEGASLLQVPTNTVHNSDLLESPYAARVLLGKKSLLGGDKDSFIKRTGYIDVSLERGVTNLSAVPYAIEVREEDHPEVLRLYYYDKIGTDFIVQSSYTIKDRVLTLSPCGSVFEDAQPLQEELQYEISLEHNRIRLKMNSTFAEYRSECEALKGAAQGPAYQEITAFDVPSIGESVPCQLLFTDGGKTNNATIKTVYESLQNIRISWTEEQRLYNGAMADFAVDKYCDFYFLNTYPYGFLLMDGDNNFYFYQAPYPSAD